MTPEGPPPVKSDLQAQPRWIVEFASLPVLALMSLILMSVLGALVLPGTLGISRCDFSRKAHDDIRKIDSALEAYAIAHGGKYPATLSVLSTADANGRTFFDGNHIPEDIWGREYIYELPDADQLRPHVICYGRDGVPGGEGDDADVDNLSLR